MDSAQGTSDDRVIFEEVGLKIKQKPYVLTLTATRLQWQVVTNKSNGKVTSVRCADIIACRTTGDQAHHLLTFSYIVEGKNLILKRKEVTFNGDAVVCDHVREQIQGAIHQVSWRPKSLLVFINPISGRSKGQQVYTSKIAPIFAEAEIKTDVIVTERAHHTEEVLKTYNLEAIDGIVLVGGDGLYHELSNGLVHRMALDAGQDSNNPSHDPAEFPIPVGIIPCGTGNGIVRAAVGNYDFISAAWSIVLGYRTKNNIHSVFCGDQLVSYGSLLEGYGLWGDTIHDAETHRHLGIWRYPLAIGRTFLFKEHRRLNVSLRVRNTAAAKEWNERNMSYITEPGQSDSREAHASNKDATKDISTPEGKPVKDPEKLGDSDVTSGDSSFDGIAGVRDQSSDDDMLTQSMEITAIMGFSTADFAPCVNSNPQIPISDLQTYAALLITKPSGKVAAAKFLGKFAMNLDTVLNQTDVNFPILLTREYSVKLNNPSDTQTASGQLEHIMNIDGEIFSLRRPEFSVRVFPSRIPLFCNIPRITGRRAASTAS